MSQFNAGPSKGFVATSALREGIGVKLSSGQVVAATANTDDVIGFTMNSCEAGETVSVRLINAQGTTKARAGGNISVGNYLTVDGDGEVVAATQTTAGSQPTVTVVGQALEAGVDNDLIEILPMYFLY